MNQSLGLNGKGYVILQINLVIGASGRINIMNVFIDLLLLAVLVVIGLMPIIIIIIIMKGGNDDA